MSYENWYNTNSKNKFTNNPKSETNTKFDKHLPLNVNVSLTNFLNQEKTVLEHIQQALSAKHLVMVDIYF